MLVNFLEDHFMEYLKMSDKLLDSELMAETLIRTTITMQMFLALVNGNQERFDKWEVRLLNWNHELSGAYP